MLNGQRSGRLPRGAAPIKSEKVRTNLPGQAGIVSVEAGFDRGYLKKARASHIGLIEEINKFRASMALNLPNVRQALKQAQENAQLAESEKLQLQHMIQKVVAQNLQLVERARQLESQIKEIRNIKSMTRHSSLRE
ncbi:MULTISPECIES: hypothetical protein [unclassified Pseudomonas]|uniref:hypothetical protein n=1 Tax=unclassified Pseudomonas TaxID=196821 RepID=UPI00235ED976|nr:MULTISPECIES: hypothetical protein [unclassified Pseudomonas]